MTGETAELLSRLFPFHVRIGADGRVAGQGASMMKVLPDAVGCGFFDRFEVQRPRLPTLEDVRAHLDPTSVLEWVDTALDRVGAGLDERSPS